ncbi:MAG: glycine cleavage system protein GcvH [Desulfarculaceae bacterium]|nr:glycine cleavage system protein GcvH [Desulfarculaceae bacterium]MCF8047220.1 glycine cleavage system protein GcvH [Desulfarculaceae bacterium]MCF8065375.1 glycine cleavage system protein GcvH [Desulfarculaceae bacterium]MCF8099043.1 glycine cleavage system protein GcvH [Desulfarculaceae bacterium]MCF8122825.1 glycine cleavage system protein GcvH [Desulfarculaceae bacterium]
MWVRLEEGGEATLGVSDYAQDQLGTVIYVDLPEVEQELSMGEELGAVESAKSVSDLISPVSGAVLEVNQRLEDTPDLINLEPYIGGWIVRVKLADPEELDELYDAGKYEAKLD